LDQLRDRHAEQPAAAEQIEVELVAGLLTEMARRHRPVPQPRRERADPLAGDLDVRAERDDQHDPEERALRAAHRRLSTLVEVRGADDDALQSGIRDELPDDQAHPPHHNPPAHGPSTTRPRNEP